MIKQSKLMITLNSVMAGMEIVIDEGRGYGPVNEKRYKICRVSKTTATQIIVGKERYRRRDGYLIGHNDSWRSHPKIVLNDTTSKVIMTPEEGRALIKEQKDRDYRKYLAEKIARLNTSYARDNLSVETLEQVCKMLYGDDVVYRTDSDSKIDRERKLMENNQ